MLSCENNVINEEVKNLITYIDQTIGLNLTVNPFPKNETDKLPMYLKEGYRWHKAELGGRPCVLAETVDENNFGIAQMEKHFALVRNVMGLPVIAVFNELEAYNRKRLIERKIGFIVPNKQVYIPDFFIDLKEYGIISKKERGELTPTAQLLLLHHLLNNQEKERVESKAFKELAVLLGTNPMGISRAVDNLKQHQLIEVTGDKEKYIHFLFTRKDLWTTAKQHGLLINPVLKKVYVDEKPEGKLLRCNMSALTEYSDMNPDRQEYFAVEKNLFYALQKNKALVNDNGYEGQYCLEVWKYNPEIVAALLPDENLVVDPLSLYLSLKDSHDERVQMALEQIKEKFVW